MSHVGIALQDCLLVGGQTIHSAVRPAWQPVRSVVRTLPRARPGSVVSGEVAVVMVMVVVVMMVDF